MKRIDNLLPYAMDALRASGLIFHNQSILKEYDGYVSSFPPSVITAGLRATLSFYWDKHKDRADGKPRRNHVLVILHQIYQKMHEERGDSLTGDILLNIALRNNLSTAEQRQLKKDLVDCAIALKLVLRNFEQVENPPPPASPSAPTVHETAAQP